MSKLFNPGPINVSPATFAAMCRPMIGHRDAPAQRRAQCIGPAFVLRHLAGVVIPDPRGGQFQRGAVIRADLGAFRRNLGRRKPQGRRRDRQPVEPQGQIYQRHIAPRPDIGDDARDDSIHIWAILALGR